MYHLSKFSIRLANLNAVHRLALVVGLAILFYIAFTWFGVKTVTGIMLSWDIFSLLMIVMSWILFFNIPQEKMDQLARREDESRSVIFIIVLVSVLISLFGIVIILKNNRGGLIDQKMHETVSMVGVAFSWVLLHTIFTQHYAHLFYDEDQELGTSKGGINFPDEQHPDFLDFAYFSFVIGMTFQVSDVTISARKVRRLALLHGIIAFLFNTIIVALTISIIAR